MRSKRKKWIALVLAGMIAASVLIAACSQPAAEQREESVVQINPLPEAVSSEKASTRLYFGYFSEKLLVGENRVFDVPDNESVEKAIIGELIKGPSATRTDFVQVINPKTQIVSVEARGQFLFVTLSKEFAEPFGEEIDTGSEERASSEKTRRYLAVYSIVNTLVEQGTYSRVSILIDEEGKGRPLTSAEAGLDGADTSEPFERDGSIELNGQNTMREIFNAIEKKDWNTLYEEYIAYKLPSGGDRPTLEEFRSEVNAANPSVSGYGVIDSVISQDGLNDVVMVDYTLKLQGYEARVLTNIPIRLVQENDVWKISYTVFKNKFLT